MMYSTLKVLILWAFPRVGGDKGSRIFYPGWQDFRVEVLVFLYSEPDDNLTVHGMWKTSLQTSLLQGERLSILHPWNQKRSNIWSPPFEGGRKGDLIGERKGAGGLGLISMFLDDVKSQD
jgi:hypothetical protein